MKNRFKMKSIALSILFISSMMILPSCDDWTKQESLDIDVPKVETEDNALYQQYLENLRTYKKTYHQLLIGWFDNSDKSFASRAMHLNSVPDKVDIISLMEADNLTQIELNEMATLRNDMGTKVIYTIDYDAIALKINTTISDAQEAVDGGDTEIVVPEFFQLFEPELDRQFALLAKYKYDGLCLAYKGFSMQFPTVVDKDRITRIQNMLFDRLAAISPGVVLFAGLPENIIDRSQLMQFDYIVLQTQSAVDINGIGVLAGASLQADVPADRIIIAALPPSLDPGDPKTGMFTDKTTAIVSSAKWMKTPGSFTKAGLAIYRINDDYYNPELDYKNTREAIEIMNPSPQQ